MTNLAAFERSDTRGSWFVLAEGDTLDDAQVSGRWIKTTDAVNVER